MKQFNIDMNNIRKLWGIPKGATLIYNGKPRFVGVREGFQLLFLNDNMVKS